MIKIRNQVLLALYWKSGEVRPSEIAKDTGLTLMQVHGAIIHLKNSKYIIVRRVKACSDGSFKPAELHIKLSNPQLTERTLRGKGLL